MIKKVVNFFRELRAGQIALEEKSNQQELWLKELYWANVYHDSIRGKEFLTGLSLNVGRWAGNYSFFYLLNRILAECSPNSICEMGLGESTKFINAYLDNQLNNSTHVVVEHDLQWIERVKSRSKISAATSILHLPIDQITVKDKLVNVYKDLDIQINRKFELYIADGFSSEDYSRYDIIRLSECLETGDDFIIIIDDTNRSGEQQTVNMLIQRLSEKSIKVSSAYYEGLKGSTIITSDKYSFLLSL